MPAVEMQQTWGEIRSVMALAERDPLFSFPHSCFSHFNVGSLCNRGDNGTFHVEELGTV